jgi:hypothetical protein
MVKERTTKLMRSLRIRIEPLITNAVETNTTSGAARTRQTLLQGKLSRKMAPFQQALKYGMFSWSNKHNM